MTDQNKTDKKINTAGILSRKAMIATLSTSCWGASKTDKEASKEVTESKNAEDGYYNVTKKLLKKDIIKPIKAIVRKMKSYHDSITLPWDNKGGRLLPTTKYQDYMAYYRQCSQEMEDAVTDFLSEYSNHVTEASYKLNDGYNPEEYPSEADVKRKFGMDIKFDTVPEVDDFRVDIPEYEQKAICRQIEERVERQHAEAMRRIWNRVYKTVEHVYQTLENENAIFRNTLIGNVQDLVDILPELNILKDQNLQKMTDELNSTLCSHDPEELRKDKDKRKDVAKESKRLLDQIGAYFTDGRDPITNDDSSDDPDSDMDHENETEETTEIEAA